MRCALQLDRLQVAIVTLLRGEKPSFARGAPRAQSGVGVGRRLELVARGVTTAAELGIAVVATWVAASAVARTPSPTDSIDAAGLRQLAAQAATLAIITGFGAAAAVRWRRRFWWIQLVVGSAVVVWYLIVQGA